jgi:CrcB protein
MISLENLRWQTFMAVGIGGALGCWLRWLLAIALNAVLPLLPLGTLAANLGGAFVMGLALGYYSKHTGWPLEWRLLIQTGFLGGLTTFSTFSGESFVLLQRGEMLWALTNIGANLIGSLVLCALGYAVIRGAG